MFKMFHTNRIWPFSQMVILSSSSPQGKANIMTANLGRYPMLTE